MSNKGKKYQFMFGIVIILFVMGLIYCGVLISKNASKGHFQKVEEPTSSPVTTRTFIGVVKALDYENESISILGTDNPVSTNFRYNGGTDVRSQYGNVISMKKISLGEIVEFTYDSKTNKLLTLKMYDKAWTYENVHKMRLDQQQKVIQLGNSNYGFTDNLLYVGQDGIIEALDLSPKDQLTVKGIGDTVYSIIVTRGHGMIRFTNIDDFVGGTVYIGASTYLKVTKVMRVTMREGTYKLTMQKDSLIGTKEVTVERGQEVTVDMSEFKLKKADIGLVDFEINPYGADLYIDNVATDYSKPVALNYGNHTIRVELNGYKSFAGVLTVGQDEQEIEVNLVPDTSKGESSGSDEVEQDQNDTDDIVLDWNSDKVTASPSASPSIQPTQSSEATKQPSQTTPAPSASSKPSSGIDTLHKITISSPEGVEVYMDDAYKGIAPVSFSKALGSHTITLKKEGYTTKTYTIHVEDNNENVFYSFASLVKG